MYGDQNTPTKKYFQGGFPRNGHLQVGVNQGRGVTPGGCYWCIKMILYYQFGIPSATFTSKVFWLMK